MALVAVSAGQQIQAAQLDQIINLLTGVMHDQQTTLRGDYATIGDNLVLSSNTAATKGAWVGFADAGTDKWELGKESSNNLTLWDNVKAWPAMSFTSNGGVITINPGVTINNPDFTAPDFIPTGLTGATNGGMRFVGTTSAGPPLSGTFAVGDFIYDMTTYGRWVCTVAGTSGTWVALEGAITSPPAPTIVVNTTGATTYYYAIVAEGVNGSTFYEAIPSQSTKITNGAATPNNTVNWTQPVGCAPISRWIVLVSTDNLTWNRIALLNTLTLSFTDTNQTRFAYTPKTANPGGGKVIGSQLYEFRAYQTGTAQGMNGVVEPIHFNNVSATALGNAVVSPGFDPNGNYDPTTNYTYTIPVAGYYAVSLEVMINQGATTGSIRLRGWISVNGNEFIEGAEVISGGANSFPASSVADTIYLRAGDTIRAGMFFNSGAGPVLYNTNAASRFAAKYLGS